MSVSVDPTAKTFSYGLPVKVADAYYTGGSTFAGRTYDVSPDDTKFLVIKEPTTPVHPNIVVVQNWVEELKARVPVK